MRYVLPPGMTNIGLAGHHFVGDDRGVIEVPDILVEANTTAQDPAFRLGLRALAEGEEADELTTTTTTAAPVAGTTTPQPSINTPAAGTSASPVPNARRGG